MGMVLFHKTMSHVLNWSSMLQVTNVGSTLMKGIATNKMWGELCIDELLQNGPGQFTFELCV